MPIVRYFDVNSPILWPDYVLVLVWLNYDMKIFIKEEGGLDLKFSKPRFLDNGWPKKSSKSANFWLCIKAQVLRPIGAHVVATPIFPPKKTKSDKKVSYP